MFTASFLLGAITVLLLGLGALSMILHHETGNMDNWRLARTGSVLMMGLAFAMWLIILATGTQLLILFFVICAVLSYPFAAFTHSWRLGAQH